MRGDHPGGRGREEETQIGREQGISPKSPSIPDPASMSWWRRRAEGEMASCQERFCCPVLSVSKPQGRVVKTAGVMESKKAGVMYYSLYVLAE